MKLLCDIVSYLCYLNNECKLGVSVHFDFYNQKSLPQLEELSVFNSHTNPYCIKLKGEVGNHEKCISFQKELYEICKKKEFLIKKCHAGVYQYIHRIEKEGSAVGFSSVSSFNDKIFLNEEDIPVSLCNAVIPPLCVMLDKLFSVFTEKSPDEFNAVIQFLNEYHTNITLFDLCEHFMRSKSHISHMFKKNCGMTINEYCNNLKLEDAKKLLISTNFSVTEIAYDTGFNDVSYFISLFKKKYGASPLKYRKTN